jgi:FtsP/CotA-like multicopper oxidase with cupredoxin domain
MAVRSNTRVIVGAVATLLILVPLAVMWISSLAPGSYSVMAMGRADLGGGPGDGSHSQHGDVSVAELTGPADGEPDVAVELVARFEPAELAGPGGSRGVSPRVEAYTLNGTTPGPVVRATQGDLVQVTLVNESVAGGATLHWHGVDVPNAEDGVAGVTQDAVPVGGSHTYRFVVEDAGTYWYHSHQVSHEQVRRGLFGVLVVEPDGGVGADHDVVAAVHTYGAAVTLNGSTGQQRYVAAPGETARVRIVNTDNGVLRAWVAGAPFGVVAVDGRDVHRPTPVTNEALVVGAGGRADVEFTVPADGSAVLVSAGGTELVVGPADAAASASTPPAVDLDLLHYGSPVDLGFDPERPDRDFEYRIGRRPGFVAGRPGMFWTINGRMYPDVPMFVVSEGDVVRMTIENSRADNHPMHLHGHHAVVLSRNGVAATGSPLWVDSLEVGRGESYEIAFVADNPGIWMDHCHDLEHAVDGLVAHLAYTGVSTPYLIGGPASNEPE